jgi:hypothetical protein
MSRPNAPYRCAVSIYAARETLAVLEQTVMCAMRSAADMNNAVVDVLVNGNPSLA